ncbi:MAG: Efflux ABC transporter, ATP-binding protein [uncultured Rubrobacteraceae bacterium]|uniref:Efflux ABC transporter, ATP-binding protein n=1 Tax=uncultured Rubrobacteraceae bacterium TaxID=349277 RepID=A0A6J4PCT6_9ACTN|nr:MAG: Efflux ABC transporter, ATP-binding protein [uncultured Rubrobacteraceae bacterium]
MAAIEVENLVKRFDGEEVLGGLDLTVEEGEIFGLIGPSGSGKSTFMRTLTGYLTPSEGKVEVLDKPPLKFTPRDRRRVGFMPQGFVLYGELSLRQNLNFVAGLYGLSFGERRRRVRETLEFVELWEHRRKTGANVSGGMQRRLQLAAAIVHDPELLFVDEPTANLDPILRRRFWEEFRRLREEGRTLFVTTQYVGEAELCDRVGLLQDGALVAVGTPEELRRRAFGGELVQLALRGEPSQLGTHLEAIEKIGRVVEVRKDEGSEEAISRVRLLVEDADVALPKVMEALHGAEVRSLDVPKPSFDEVFFRLVEGTNVTPEGAG